MTLDERYRTIQSQIQSALERSPFGPRQVTIMGASKAQSLKVIRAAADLGLLDMGENYAQELLTKAPLCLDTPLRWHFIGRLQSNKIKHLLPYVTTIGSIDSLELAERIARVRETLDAPRPAIPILLQVNQGSERQKSGLPPAVMRNLFSRFVAIDGVQVVGLMCIPPQTKDIERTRGYFKELKALFDELLQKHSKPEVFKYLSMGMSSDFEVAIEEGSNLVRIGEALFGPRPVTKKT
jgi:pyridoxal phosphate enzyme (YggS family)